MITEQPSTLTCRKFSFTIKDTDCADVMMSTYNHITELAQEGALVVEVTLSVLESKPTVEEPIV